MILKATTHSNKKCNILLNESRKQLDDICLNKLIVEQNHYSQNNEINESLLYNTQTHDNSREEDGANYRTDGAHGRAQVEIAAFCVCQSHGDLLCCSPSTHPQKIVPFQKPDRILQQLRCVSTHETSYFLT